MNIKAHSYLSQFSQIESCYDCACDSLTAYDGFCSPTRVQLAKLCGRLSGNILVSSTNRMSVAFVTDRGVSGDDVTATFSAIGERWIEKVPNAFFSRDNMFLAKICNAH